MEKKSYHAVCPRCREQGRAVWYTWKRERRGAFCPSCILDGYGPVELRREADPPPEFYKKALP